jgi:hypothetical protein
MAVKLHCHKIGAELFRPLAALSFQGKPAMSLLGGGLNRSTQHFILKRKMECGDGSGI